MTFIPGLDRVFPIFITEHITHFCEFLSTMVSDRLNRLLALVRVKLPKALAITVFAFVLSSLLLKPLSFSASAFLSNPEKSDFAMTDVYTILADSREVRDRDRNILVVNLRGLDRNGIAQVLELMPLLNVRAVGLDVVFMEPREDDSRLLAAVAGCPGLVMAESMRRDADGFVSHERSFFADSVAGDVRRGVTTFPARYAKSTIREFRGYFPTSEGDTVASFAVAMAEAGAPEAVASLRERGKTLELINYASRDVDVVMPEEIADRAEDFEGRFVLLGDVDDLFDKHATPLNSTVSGVMIHAAALSTILDGVYLDRMGDAGNKVLAFAICLVILLIWHMFSAKEVLLRGGTVRLIQLTMVVSMIVTGYVMFVRERFVWDFSYTLLMITFGLFANDIWLFGEYLFVELPRKRRQRRMSGETGGDDCEPLRKEVIK